MKLKQILVCLTERRSWCFTSTSSHVRLSVPGSRGGQETLPSARLLQLRTGYLIGEKKRKCCSCVCQRFCFLALCADGDKQEINKTEERKSEVSAIVLMYLLILAVGHKPSSPSCTRVCLMSAHFFVFCVILTFGELSNRGPVFIGMNLLKLCQFCVW